jgi:hypothetical protein
MSADLETTEREACMKTSSKMKKGRQTLSLLREGPIVAMPQLQHVFAAGVRFDTEVQYRLAGRQARRYCRLPVKSPDGEDGDGALLSLAQCVAVLCQVPFRQAYASLQPLERTDADWHPVKAIEVAGRHCCVDELKTSRATRIGSAALRAICAGHMCRVRFASQTDSRWATVIGVEGEIGCDQPRALLLLDARTSEPWACGHNARIELRHVATQAVRAGPGFRHNYRCLTGEACAVRLDGLVTVRRNHN